MKFCIQKSLKRALISLITLGMLSSIFVAGSVNASSATSTLFKKGALVNVNSCVSVDEGIYVQRWIGTQLRSYVLPNGIRNAGHGLREYILECVGDNTYRVYFRDVIEIQPEPEIVSVKLSDSSPEQGIVLADTNKTHVASFEVKAGNEAIEVNDLSFACYQSGPLCDDKFSTVTLYMGANSVTSSYINNNLLHFDNLNQVIAANETATFSLKADVNAIDPNNNPSGAAFYFALKSISAKGVSSGNTASFSNSVQLPVNANTMVVRASRINFQLNPNNNRNLINGHQKLLQFTVQAIGSGAEDAGLNMLTFTYSLAGYGAANAILEDLKLYTDGYAPARLVFVAGGPAQATFKAYFDREISIPAGSSRSFTLDGTVLNASSDTILFVGLDSELDQLLDLNGEGCLSIDEVSAFDFRYIWSDRGGQADECRWTNGNFVGPKNVNNVLY